MFTGGFCTHQHQHYHAIAFSILGHIFSVDDDGVVTVVLVYCNLSSNGQKIFSFSVFIYVIFYLINYIFLLLFWKRSIYGLLCMNLNVFQNDWTFYEAKNLHKNEPLCTMMPYHCTWWINKWGQKLSRLFIGSIFWLYFFVFVCTEAQ